MDSKFQIDLIDYILSGHALLSVDTFEKNRCIEHISKVAKQIERKIFIWSAASGWLDEKGMGVKDGVPNGQIAPEEVIKSIHAIPENSICILKEFCIYLHHETYNSFDLVVSWVEEIREILSNSCKTIIFLDSAFKAPNCLKNDITNIDFPLPEEEDVANNIKFVCEGVTTKDGKKFEPNQELLPDITKSCSGMTNTQIIDRLALSIRKHKDLNQDALKTILSEKASVIKKSGILQYIEPPPGGLSNIGGYGALKNHLKLDKPCFSDEARKFGIRYPRGLMLVGIPGCGKSLITHAIGSEFNLPLVSMDIGSIMNQYVGSSEANMREALKIIESVAPCVLQLDEIEKGLGGSGDLDGGASRRVFGTFLKWLSDRTSPVYLAATANDISSIPVEFLRSGRFDAVFALDLPNDLERKSIFNIHITKRKRDPLNYDIKSLVEKTNGFTGSDIEQVIELSLKIAFCQKTELSQGHLEIAIDSIIPLSKLSPEKIQQTKEWGAKHARNANSPSERVVDKKGRKIIS
jgi:ATP-dependent 26S proteasome regulatory subunit